MTAHAGAGKSTTLSVCTVCKHNTQNMVMQSGRRHSGAPPNTHQLLTQEAHTRTCDPAAGSTSQAVGQRLLTRACKQRARSVQCVVHTRTGRGPTQAKAAADTATHSCALWSGCRTFATTYHTPFPRTQQREPWQQGSAQKPLPAKVAQKATRALAWCGGAGAAGQAWQSRQHVPLDRT